MSHYTLTRRIIAFGHDYDLRDGDGKLVYRVDGKLRFATTLVVRDGDGNKLVSAREKLLAWEYTVLIRRGAEVIGTLKKIFYDVKLTSTREKYVLTLPDGAVLEARGDFYRDDWRLFRGPQTVAQVEQEREAIVRETQHVTINDAEDEPLICAVIGIILKMHPYRGDS